MHEHIAIDTCAKCQKCVNCPGSDCTVPICGYGRWKMFEKTFIQTFRQTFRGTGSRPRGFHGVGGARLAGMCPPSQACRRF
jgi:hypothetical protein